MEIEIKDYILAIITTDAAKVMGGSCPVFIAAGQEQQEKMTLVLSRILGGIPHDLENGVYLIVKH